MEYLPENSLLKEGRNCWKINPATRFSVIIDASACFRAMAWAIQRAEKSVCILSWDIDSRISLVPENKDDGASSAELASLPLADFFLKVAEQRPDLHVYILTWDYAFIYADERESRSEALKRFCRHPNIHLKFDRTGSFLTSHHQKIVVVDNQVAFCGGLDLTQRRWDTPDHRVHNFFRKDPDGKKYGPFHDVQTMVEGAPAAALGHLFCDRWEARTKERLTTVEAYRGQNLGLWPEFIPPTFQNHDVAIVRTLPSPESDLSVRECEALYADSIRRVKKTLFIENQYLTSSKIGDLLVERLSESDPPEIIILVRLHSSKWVEAATVNVLRARLLTRLKLADKKNKLLVMCPFASVEKDVCVNLHSKVFISDDEFLRIGSSNLCGRSMGMDTEGDLAVEAQNEKDRAAIRSIRHRLLSEHLGISVSDFETALGSKSELIPVIQKFLGKKDRTLILCPDESPVALDWIAPNAELIDPDSPRQFQFALLRTLFSWVFIGWIVFVLLRVEHWITSDTLQAVGTWVQEHPAAPVIFILLFAVMTALAFPFLPLVVAFSLILPPLETFLYTLFGGVLSAALVYQFAKLRVGKHPNGFLARLLEVERVKQVRAKLKKRGLGTIILIRLLPVAPFWVVNFCMGVVDVKFWHFLLATCLGLLPGLFAISYSEDQLSARGEQHLIIVVILGLSALGWGIKKLIQYWSEVEKPYADSRQL